MTTRELLQMALEALDDCDKSDRAWHSDVVLMNKISAHLAQPDETAELLREMGEALEKYQKRESMDDLEDADYAMDDALAKYRGMKK